MNKTDIHEQLRKIIARDRFQFTEDERQAIYTVLDMLEEQKRFVIECYRIEDKRLVGSCINLYDLAPSASIKHGDIYADDLVDAEYDLYELISSYGTVDYSSAFEYKPRRNGIEDTYARINCTIKGIKYAVIVEETDYDDYIVLG